MGGFMDRHDGDDSATAPIDARWHTGVACPSRRAGPYCDSFPRVARLYIKCPAWRHQWSAISGTILEASKLKLSGGSTARRTWMTPTSGASAPGRLKGGRLEKRSVVSSARLACRRESIDNLLTVRCCHFDRANDGSELFSVYVRYHPMGHATA